MRRWYSSCPRSPCVCFTPFARLPWRHLVFPSCFVPSGLCHPPCTILAVPVPIFYISSTVAFLSLHLWVPRSTVSSAFYRSDCFFLSCDGLYHGPPSYNLITFFFALSICYNSKHRSCSSPHSAFVEPPCNVYSSFPLFSTSYYRPRRNRQR